MKSFKRILLVVGMVLCLGGGISGALAITRTGAANTGTGAFDKAINLYWDSDSTTKSFTDIEDLSVNVPVYRYLSVSPKSTKTVAGTVTVSFELSTVTPSSGDPTLAGLTVKVFKTDSLADDSTVAALIAGKTAEVTLTKDNLTGNATFSVTVDTAAHETKAYYAIQVVYDGSDLAGKTLSGKLDITQNFA